MTPSIKVISVLVALLISGQGRDYSPVNTRTARRIVKAVLRYYKRSPILLLSVLAKESGFRKYACYKGAHGLGQVQLKNKDCSAESKDKAAQRGLYKIYRGVLEASKLAKQWEAFCTKNHKNKHDWLLHYNQGLGFCSKKRCKREDYRLATKGYLGGYGNRIRKLCSRMRKRLPVSMHKRVGKCTQFK